MRKILSGLAIGLMAAQALALSPTPSYAAGAPATIATADAALMALPLIVRKSKAKKEKSLDAKIKISPMPNVKHGQTAVPVTVQVPQSGLTCRLEIKYYGTGDVDSPDDVISDGNGICQFYFDAARDKDAIGDAKATVKVSDHSKNSQGESSVNFDVR